MIIGDRLFSRFLLLLTLLLIQLPLNILLFYSNFLGPTRNSQSSHDLVSVVPKEEPKPVPVEPPPNIVEAVPAPLPPVAMKKVTSPTSADSTESQQMIANLKSKIADQEEQIQTLIKKRRDDVEKFKEFERTKLQLDQVNFFFCYRWSFQFRNRFFFLLKLQSYKREAQERIKELNDKLKHQENELKETREKFSAYRDEMNDTEIRLESLTLDLEMAEEKVLFPSIVVQCDSITIVFFCSARNRYSRKYNIKRKT